MVKSAPDSRLLESLIKQEAKQFDSFKSWTDDASAAATSLNAWAVADSGDIPDLMEISMRVSALLTECSDSQRTYLQALSSYRSSLKDVLEREKEVRTILRDREILVTRVLRLSTKRPGNSDKANDSYNIKVDEASKELGACEAALKAEEMALAGVKLRIFKEALGMRLRSQSDMGLLWHETANEAIGLLDRLRPDAIPDNIDFTPHFPEEHDGPYEGSPHIGSTADNSPMPEQHAAAEDVGDSSSIEDDQRPTVAHTRGASEPIQLSRSPRGSFSTPRPAKPVATASPFPPSASGRRTTTVPEETAGDTSDEEAAIRSDFRKRNQRQAVSESGYSDSNVGGNPKKSGGFFGGIAGLFKSRKVGENGTPPSSPRKSKESRWSTRTDSNLHVINEQNKAAEKYERQQAALNAKQPSTRRRVGSDSSDERPRNLVKVVNNTPLLWQNMGITPPDQTVVKTKKRSGSFSIAPSSMPLNVPHYPQRAMSDPGDLNAPMKPRKVKKSTSSTTARPVSLSRANSSASTATNRMSVASMDQWTVTPKKQSTKYTPSLMSVVSNDVDPATSQRYGNNLGVSGGTIKKKKSTKATSNPTAPKSALKQSSRPPSIISEVGSMTTLALPSASAYQSVKPDALTVLELPSAAASRSNAMTRTERALSTLTLPTAPPPVSSMSLHPEPAQIARAPSPIPMPQPIRNGILHSPSTPRSRSPVGGVSANGGGGTSERRKSVRIAGDEPIDRSFMNGHSGPGGDVFEKSEKAKGKERSTDQDDETPYTSGGWTTRIGRDDDSDDDGVTEMSEYAKARRAMQKTR